MNTQDPVAFRRWQFRWRASIATCAALLTFAGMTVVEPLFLLVFPVATAAWLLWWAWHVGRAARVVAICVTGGLVAIGGALEMQSRAESGRIEALRASTESTLTTRLSLGDGPEKIERVLREIGLHFTYSEVLHGYYASLAKEIPDCHVDITLKVTESKHLVEVRVRTTQISS